MNTIPLKDFQLEIFKEAIKNDLSNNVVISPISLLFPLAILSKGAKGQTLSEFQKVLNDSANKNIYTENLNVIYNTIKNDECLKIANAILTKVKVNAPFIQKGQSLNIQFDALKNAQQVNAWVKEKTNGKINKIIDQIDPLCIMMILNALYFHDNWKYKLDSRKTKLETFYLSDQKEKKVNLMYHFSKNAIYFQNDKLQAIKLLYNTSKISATIVLPNKSININDFILNMNTHDFFNIFHNMKTEEVELYLPKIKLETSMVLNQMLDQLGLKEAFKESADFSSLTNHKPIYISNVNQKTYFEMDEKGTTAAAVTSVMKTLSINSINKICYVMRCDRPYLIFLTQYCPGIKKTLILFCAKIENP